MSKFSPWDRPTAPDLSKLPAHLRPGLSEPLPIRDNEVNAKIVMFQQRGLNHPNGRIWVRPFVDDPTAVTTAPSAAEIQLTDFSARLPLGAVVVGRKALLPLLRSLLLTYKEVGGDLVELANELEPYSKKCCKGGKSKQSTPCDFGAEDDDSMEKYGVDESPKEGEKQAETKKPNVCPLCGAKLLIHGNVVLCPTHGSKPFESA